jgi:hypothetical protein
MRYVILLAMVIGCGGSSGDGLEGTKWALTTADGCVTGVAFNAGAYKWITACSLTDGSPAAEIEAGEYSTAGSSLTLVMREVTCPSTDYVSDTATADYTVSSSRLTLSTSAGLLVFAPLTSPGNATAITYGCFDPASMAFTAMPSHPF